MTKVVVIDYGSGNIHSVQKAVERAAMPLARKINVLVTHDPDRIYKADALILPGVGAFADCRRGIDAVSGLTDALQQAVMNRGRPFLGICVGMQLMASFGREHIVSQGLNWIKGDVVALNPADPHLKVPHMGWNTLEFTRTHPALGELCEQEHHAYFVHSYHMQLASQDALIAQTEYGEKITAIVGKDTYLGTQFHPEKSQTFGLSFLSHFLRWRP